MLSQMSSESQMSRESSYDDLSVDSTALTSTGAVREFYQAYEVKELLGKGLTSSVRRCIEKASTREFAVKIIDLGTERQTMTEAMRLRDETKGEVQVLRLLAGHPSIIRLHDFYDGGTFVFVVFEMAPGGELFDALNKAVTFSEKRTKRVMRQIFEGVKHMRDKNVIHRDLKLENILCLSGSGTLDMVKITDYGFAKQLQPGELLKELCGTPGYLAPEVLRCQMYDDSEGYSFEADMWACGVIMYTLLAGYAPFYHRRPLLMLRRIQEGKYDLVGEPWANISSLAKDLISRLLDVDVSQRATVDDALDHPFVAVQPIEAPMPRMSMSKRFKHAIMQVNFFPLKQTNDVENRMEKRNRLFDFEVRFIIRLKKMKEYNRVGIDSAFLRQRPYRDKQIRHESDAAVFAIFGHWINKGFQQSRDVLFASKPRRKR